MNRRTLSPSTVYCLPSTCRRRSGFTLVELLMVIVIIGMLAGLITAAAVRAIGQGKNTQITMEISLLDSAMQTYKNDTGGAYPPDCSLLSTPASGTPTNQDVLNRQNRILAHLRKAFPRLIIAGGYGSSSSPSPGTLQYMSINAYSQSAQTYSTTAGAAQFSNTKTPNGVSQWGDFDNMDPAEAMVFWLGGFAIPNQDSTGKWTYKLIGFSANKVGNASSAGPNNNGPNSGFGPFNLDVQSRDTGPFEFSQGRLGDADGDGWPEYYQPNATVPQPPGSTVAVSSATPPYVYFDYVSYNSLASGTTVYPQSAIYPSPSATVSTSVSAGSPGAQPNATINPAAAMWGVVMPYVQTVGSNGAITWQNPQKFQIISGGLDQSYALNASTSGAGQPGNTLRSLALPSSLSQGDLDNLTNFTTGVLQP